jgi:hypothetical protein
MDLSQQNERMTRMCTQMSRDENVLQMCIQLEFYLYIQIFEFNPEGQ